jgi:alkylated DNA repair dioxygenase AlkB
MADRTLSPLPAGETVLPDGCQVSYTPGLFSVLEADRYLNDLLGRGEGWWERIRLPMFGRSVLEPRLTKWVGDFDYTYSGVRRPKFPWDPLLEAIRDAVEQQVFGVPCGRYGGVLLNQYRDGKDSIGWHGDREEEISQVTPIATVSLGAERRFRLRTRMKPHTIVLDGPLEHGSLFLMGPGVQQVYDHSIPKQAGVTSARVSLTLREYGCAQLGMRSSRPAVPGRPGR